MPIRDASRDLFKLNCALIVDFILALDKDDASIMKECVSIIARDVFAIANDVFVAIDDAFAIVNDVFIAIAITSLRNIKRSFFYTRSF